MDHDDIRHALSDYLDGSLAEGDRQTIEEHLKTCPSCADALAELQKTIEHLKNLEQVEPPAWMTQKIMARVREESEKEKQTSRRWFFPFRFPVEVVGVALLAVTAFFIYRNMQPAYHYQNQRAAQTETTAPAPALPKEEKAKAATAPPPGAVAQSPGYKALDMKQEYEPPQAPAPEMKKAMPAPAAPAPALKSAQGAAAPLAESRETVQPAMPMRDTAASPGLTARERRSAESFDRMSSGNNIETVVLDRFESGTPSLIETYLLVDSRKVKRTEERFKADGSRHGIQKDFYPSGQVRTEAEYSDGKLLWYREYQADGVKKTGTSDFSWYWLKK